MSSSLAIIPCAFCSAPIQIVLAIYFLWMELGPPVLAGLGVMILMIPINFVISTKMRSLQVGILKQFCAIIRCTAQACQMRHKDERIKMMNEVLNGMKVLKLYAWEPPMEAHIGEIRAKEVDILKQIAYLNAGTNTPILYFQHAFYSVDTYLGVGAVSGRCCLVRRLCSHVG